MEKWNIMLHLKSKKEVMQSQPIQKQRGILQGDSPSPLLFCKKVKQYSYRPGVAQRVPGS
jgi:hypothetical protein